MRFLRYAPNSRALRTGRALASAVPVTPAWTALLGRSSSDGCAARGSRAALRRFLAALFSAPLFSLPFKSRFNKLKNPYLRKILAAASSCDPSCHTTSSGRTVIGACSSIRASSRERSASFLPSRSFAATVSEMSVVPFSSAAYIPSIDPNFFRRSVAVFSPIPRTPLMLSDASPFNPLRSMSCSGDRPYRSRTSSSPYSAISLTPCFIVYTFTFGRTSCSASESPVMMITSQSFAATSSAAMVPIISSASYPSFWNIGIPKASTSSCTFKN